MKKAIAFGIIAIFVLSMIPLAFAEEKAAANANPRAEAKRAENLKKIEILKEQNRAKIEALDAEKLDKISNIGTERLQKIAELDKAQIERLAKLNVANIDKIAELKKERLERLTALQEQKLKRISGLEKENLEKISDLTSAELETLSTYNSEEVKAIAKLDIPKIKARLNAVKILKIKNAEALDRRNIAEARLAEIREKYQGAKERFDKIKEEAKEAREKLKEAQANKDDAAIIQRAKEYLLKTADTLTSHLEKVKAKVQESENIPDDRETQIVAEIDAKISEIATIKTEIEAATTKEQLRESAKKLNDIWAKLRHAVKLYTERVISARVEGLVNQGRVLEKKLESILQRLDESGIEVDVTAEVDSFRAQITLGKDKFAQAQAKLSEALTLKAKGTSDDAENIKKLVEEAKALLKESRDAIKQAHEVLKSIVRKIKDAAPQTDLSAEVEVEIVQDSVEAAALADANTTAGAQ